jgi:hypothetical protein
VEEEVVVAEEAVEAVEEAAGPLQAPIRWFLPALTNP